MARVFSVVTLLLLAACGSQSSRIILKNSSGKLITDIRVIFGADVYVEQDIGVGDTRIIYRRFPGEGAASIHYRVGNREMSLETCYHTGGAPADGTFIIYRDRVDRTCR